MTLPKRPDPGRIPRVRRLTNDALLAWTSAEDAVLCVHYVAGGAPACETHLPGRSRVAIHRRAKRMALSNGFKRPRRLTDQQQLELAEVVSGRRHAKPAELADSWGMSEGAVRKQLRNQRQRQPPTTTIPASSPGEQTTDLSTSPP